MRGRAAPLIGIAALAVAAAPARAIERGQTEDFSGGLGAWERGEIATPGAEGPDDPYLLVGAGDGGRIVTFERARWAGDYLAAGGDEISMLVRNLGANPLVVRLAIGDNLAPLLGGSWYVTDGVPLPPGGDWQRVSFSLAPDALVKVQGGASAEQVHAGVSTLRILHATGPTAIGDIWAGSLGVDAITAVPEPGASECAAAAAAALALARRRRGRHRTDLRASLARRRRGRHRTDLRPSLATRCRARHRTDLRPSLATRCRARHRTDVRPSLATRRRASLAPRRRARWRPARAARRLAPPRGGSS